MSMDYSHKLNFIDLFCGCGGFSYGLEKAGLNCIAGIDFDKHAIDTFRLNHSASTLAILGDLTKFTPTKLKNLIGNVKVDLIVGGPPCQGFSSLRQASGSNTGKRLVDDPRRELYKFYLRYVNFFNPSLFVIENVLGIKHSQNGVYFTRIQDEARQLGYRVFACEVKAWEFGVPQKRIRQLIIGIKNCLPIISTEDFLSPKYGLPEDINNNPKLKPIITLGEAIGDLPELKVGDDIYETNYDLKLRKKYLDTYSKEYLYGVLNVHKAKKLTWHVARLHNSRDLRDFERLKEGENSGQAIARGVKLEHPYSRTNFKDRFTKQSRYTLCSTIVSDLRSGGLMFIHPTQNRSFSPREAARVQSFPDTFIFSGFRTNVFKQIGNAVPPLIGEEVGKKIIGFLKKSKKISKRQIILNKSNNLSIIKYLEEFRDSLNHNDLKKIEKKEFLRAWNAIHTLLPNLHPDSASDNGKEKSRIPSRNVSFVFEPYYLRSGWPVELIEIAQEARSRYERSLITKKEYYFF